MLEAMRKQSRSVLIYVFFGIIIAVFITTFAPSSEGFASCSSATGYVAKISGRTISESDFRYAFVLMGGAEAGANQALQARIRGAVLDKLLERELLAAEAERMGLHVADRDIEDLITSGSLVAMGSRQDAKGAFFSEGVFDYELFRRFCQYRLGQSVRDFKEQQRKELMAAAVRDVMRAAVTVSEEEVRFDFEARERQVNLELVVFSPGTYIKDIEPSEADVDGFLAQNRKLVEERYGARKSFYMGLPKQFRARHILVAADKGAGQEAQKAARARAEAILQRLRDGADFVGMVRAESDDENTKSRDGDLGWRGKGQSGFGQAFEDAAFSLQAGGVSDLVQSEAGWHILRVEGRREGDQKLEAVEREIARDLLRERRAKERARLEAEDYLRRLGSGEPWEKLFAEEGAEPPPAGPDASPRPTRRSTGLFPRQGPAIPQIGIAKDLARDAFDMTLADPLGKKPYEYGRDNIGGSGFVLAKLIERKDPNMAELEEQKAERTERYRLAKWMIVAANFARDRCQGARESGNLRVNPTVTGGGAEGAGDYVPCDTLAFP